MTGKEFKDPNELSLLFNIKKPKRDLKLQRANLETENALIPISIYLENKHAPKKLNPDDLASQILSEIDQENKLKELYRETKEEEFQMLFSKKYVMKAKQRQFTQLISYFNY